MGIVLPQIYMRTQNVSMEKYKPVGFHMPVNIKKGIFLDAFFFILLFYN